MKFKVYIRRAAELDLAAAQKWYEEQQPGLADEFYYEFGKAIDRLGETPFIYPVVYGSVRRPILHRFLFLLWYQVQDLVVSVLACTHGKADPAKIRNWLQ